jgi:competence protein ComEC
MAEVTEQESAVRRRRISAPGGGPLSVSAAWLQARLARLHLTLEAELDAGRGFLWLPVAFGVGILAYFGLPREPLALALAALVAALVAATWAARYRVAAFRVAVLAAAVAGGALAAKIRTDLVAAPVLTHEMTATIAGWVAGTEETTSGGKRLRIRVSSMSEVPPKATPKLARITVRNKATNIAVGDGVSVLASVGPPSGPLFPGGYDFAFPLYYQSVGATGFAFGSAKPAALGAAPWSIRVMEPIAWLRDLLRVRIEEALPGNNGHIAAALVMGDQRGIAEDTQNDMRASGLGHIFSISGLHLALVAGSVFWLVRALLALSPMLALNYPIKKWAAAVALATATFYTAISGAEVATVRSWVMLTIMLGAVLLDRRALTLRNVALAALLILIFSPESLLSISFEMSFAATAALISAFEAIRTWQTTRLRTRDIRERTLFRRFSDATTLLLITSLVAGLATAPFGIFYFQRVAPLTIVANLAVAPAISFIVMPMALLAVVAMPFGLEALPLKVMEWGLQWMLFVADRTTAWSDGLGAVPAMPSVALLVLTGGFLWLALWAERWRLLGVIPILAAVPIAVATPRPVVIVEETAKAAAVRGADGNLSILGGKGASFAVENWLRADGDTRSPNDKSLANGTACDAIGCVGRLADGGAVALVKRPEGFVEDCARSAVVISHYEAPVGCDAHALVIGRDQLDAFGAHAIFVDNGGYRVSRAYPEIRRPFMPPARD